MAAVIKGFRRTRPPPTPISVAEFVELLQRCRPPNGWHRRIAVANSGGPDSVCLLYLLANAVFMNNTVDLPAIEPPEDMYTFFPRQWQIFNTPKRSSGFPETVVSIHVNHLLQSTNSYMDRIAHLAASRTGSQHFTRYIPWGRPPFPSRPPPGSMEETCRQARSALLLTTAAAPGLPFEAGRSQPPIEWSRDDVTEGADDDVQVAFAHHADDQVETAIMRAMKGSTEWGISGMKPVRKWGMGDTSDIRPAGLLGMRTWVIRPLLDIPKDRILATCDAHKLEYVVDPTNFQPELTLRNYVRKHLQERELQMEVDVHNEYHPTRTARSVKERNIWENMQAELWGKPEPEVYLQPALPTRRQEDIDRAIARICPGNSRIHDLREAVRRIGQKVEMTEVRAMNTLRECSNTEYMRSKLLLRPEALREITDLDVQRAIVRRILRYVSPKPWGSLASIAHARQSSIDGIVSELWRNRPAPFSLGAEVTWKPVVFRRAADQARGLHKTRVPGPHERFFWLVERSKPPAGERNREVNLTRRLRLAKQRQFDYLYDNRFRISFSLDWEDWDRNLWGIGEGSASTGGSQRMEGLTPEEVLAEGDIIVSLSEDSGRPHIFWRRPGKLDVQLATFQLASSSPAWTGVPWITGEFVRELYSP